MKSNIERRAVELAEYIIENKATVRAAAGHFGVSKSTVHTDRAKWNGIYGRYNGPPIKIQYKPVTMGSDGINIVIPGTILTSTKSS